MADSTNTPKSASLFGYLFWKWLICLLLTVPAFAVTLLAASLLGQAGGVPDGEVGFLRYGRLFAALLGYVVFLLLCMRIWLRLKLGEMPLSSFVLRETCAYAGVLLPCALLCAVTGGNLLRTGGVSLIFLPHLPLAFFGKGWQCALLPLFQLLPYAGLAALAYLRNRKALERKIERGEEAIDGQFEEKADGDPFSNDESAPALSCSDKVDPKNREKEDDAL